MSSENTMLRELSGGSASRHYNYVNSAWWRLHRTRLTPETVGCTARLASGSLYRNRRNVDVDWCWHSSTKTKGETSIER